MKKAFLGLLLSGTFALAACGTPGSLNASSKTSSGAPATVSQSANDVSASLNHPEDKNISAKGVSSKVTKQTVSSVQSKVNEITSLDSKLSQGEQDVSINAN